MPVRVTGLLNARHGSRAGLWTGHARRAKDGHRRDAAEGALAPGDGAPRLAPVHVCVDCGARSEPIRDAAGTGKWRYQTCADRSRFTNPRPWLTWGVADRGKS